MTALMIYSGIISLAAAVLAFFLWRERKRRKPYRPSVKPPTVPVKRLRKNIGASPTRKTRARIRRKPVGRTHGKT